MAPGLLAVIRREVRWIRRDPVTRFLLFGVPVIAFVLLGLTFSAAVVRGLGVTVVDMDHSETSRLFVQTVAAAPGIAIAKRGDDLGAAARAIRSGDSIAAIYLPPDFERDLLAGRRPHAVGFYNTQYFTPGNNASKSISDAMNAAVRRRGTRDRRHAARRRSRAGPGSRGICPDQSRIELRRVPAARRAADRAARGDRDISGVCGRFGVPPPQHGRLVGRLRAQHRHRPGRQDAAVLRRAAGDVRADGGDPRPLARRRVSAATSC